MEGCYPLGQGPQAVSRWPSAVTVLFADMERRGELD